MKSIQSVIIVFLFSGFFNASYAQHKSLKFGDVTIEELQMTKYVSDSNASAVILSDVGYTRFESRQDFPLNFTKTKRVKILSKEGYKQADVAVYLYFNELNEEKIINLKASTYNLENGEIVETKLDKSAIFEERLNDNYNIVKFTFPNVKEGSIIEFRYEILSAFYFNLQDWSFQSTIPTVISEYRVRIPNYFVYQQFMQGYLALSNVEKKDVREGQSSTSIETRYVMENAPAFLEESYCANPSNFISKINFELATIKYPDGQYNEFMGSWESLNKSFLEAVGFGSQVKGSGFIKDDVELIIQGTTSDDEKISKIYNYIKSNIEWNGYHSKYATKSFRKLLDEKTGSSGDLNLLLVAMLRKAGIKADAMLSSTQQNGMILEVFPISSQFNYTLCYVDLGDNKYLVLDATDRNLPQNILPIKCLNGKGFVVSEVISGWREIKAPLSSNKLSATLTMDSDGNSKGTVSAIRSGYYASETRKKIKKSKEDHIVEFQKQLGMDFSNSEFSDLDNLIEPFKETHQVSIENDAPGADLIYFNPVLYGRYDKNPFRLEERKYPVDFSHPFDEVFYLNLQLPDNYIVEESPSTKILVLPNNDGKFSYKVTVTGNKVIIINQLIINKAIFTSEEYTALKEFFAVIVAKQSEQIVLKKTQ